MNGSLVLCDVFSFELLGRNTSLLDTPSFGKPSSLHMKLDFAPESMVNLSSLLLASHLINLFDLGFDIAQLEGGKTVVVGSTKSTSGDYPLIKGGTDFFIAIWH